MKSFQLTNNDKKILSLLRKDSRMGYKEIAARTGVAISTVHNTIKRLINRGIIKNFSVKLDSELIGFDVTAIIGVKVKHGELNYVEEQLINHPNVCQLFIVTGEFDLMLIAKFNNSVELNEFLRGFLQQIKGTERTNTSIVLETSKEHLNPSFK